jgi:predicted CxxxxCH...CXXCH cytochrome family protein
MRVLILIFFCAIACHGDAAHSAIEFLAREVPRWQPENHCFSCHNNGDAARALFLAKARGFSVAPASLADTINWLRKPESWDENHGNPAFSDRKLARVQFSAALAEAVRDGLSEARGDLSRAAGLLAALQEKDGSWKIDTGGVAGAPATYGTVVATYMAREVLQTADAKAF